AVGHLANEAVTATGGSSVSFGLRLGFRLGSGSGSSGGIGCRFAPAAPTSRRRMTVFAALALGMQRGIGFGALLHRVEPLQLLEVEVVVRRHENRVRQNLVGVLGTITDALGRNDG